MRSAISYKKGVSAYFQIKEDIISRINAGEWEIGAKIPTEIELVELYGVSRMTVRRALDELADERVLYKERGIGTFAAKRRIVRNQEHLAGLSEEMQAQGRLVRSVITANGSVERPNLAQELQQSGASIHHLQRVRSVDNEVLLIDDTYLPHAVADQAGIAELGDNESLFNRLESSGIALLYGEKEVRAMLATPHLAKALSCRHGHPLLHVRTLVHDKRGLPVLLSELFIRSDRYSIKISAQRG